MLPPPTIHGNLLKILLVKVDNFFFFLIVANKNFCFWIPKSTANYSQEE